MFFSALSVLLPIEVFSGREDFSSRSCQEACVGSARRKYSGDGATPPIGEDVSMRVQGLPARALRAIVGYGGYS